MPVQIEFMSRYTRHLFFALVAISGFSLNFSVRAEILEAQWQAHQVKFTYSGFSTRYTCDGIERTLKRLLILLGARNDVRVEGKCNSRDKIERFQRTLLAFAIPVPADKTDISREIIPAQLEDVRITGSVSRFLDSADCELVEQFQQQVIPQLPTLKVSKRVHCIPNRSGMGNLNIRMTALKALEKTELEEASDSSQTNTRQSEN